MELVTPDIKYKNSFIEALKDGFRFGAQAPFSTEKIAEVESDFESYLSNKILAPYDPTPKLRDDGKYYPNSSQIPYWLIGALPFASRL